VDYLNTIQTLSHGDRVVLTKVDVPAIGSVVAVTDEGYQVAFHHGVVSVKSNEVRKYGMRSAHHKQGTTIPFLLTSGMQIVV
jgi:hypothetical protein